MANVFLHKQNENMVCFHMLFSSEDRDILNSKEIFLLEQQQAQVDCLTWRWEVQSGDEGEFCISQLSYKNSFLKIYFSFMHVLPMFFKCEGNS